MINYIDVLNDKIIVDIYKKIGESKILWAEHGLKHINCVLDNIKRVYDIFNIDDKESENLCLIAGVLHDVGALQGKDDHAMRSFIFAKDYLISERDTKKDIILNSIKNHSCYDEDLPLETKVLVFADKCDIRDNRVSEIGLSKSGMREYINVKNVDIKFENNCLKINILTNDKFNRQEFIDFYFTKNLYLASCNLAKHFGASCKICINDIEEIF